MNNSEKQDWIGFDLDGTIAHYESWQPDGSIGEPIPSMIQYMKILLSEGAKLKIMTARATEPENIPAIQDWLEAQGLPRLEVTCIKDRYMSQLFDDNAIQVIRNEGNIVFAPPPGIKEN